MTILFLSIFEIYNLKYAAKVYRLIDAALIGIFSMIPYLTIEILAKRSLKMMLDLKGLIYGNFSIPYKSKCNFIEYKLF